LRILLVLLLVLCACERSTTQTTRTIFFRGDVVATVVETTPWPRAIRRVTRLNDELITLTATLDDDGFARAAVSDRPRIRHMELKDGAVVDDVGHRIAVSGPVLLLELVHRVRTTDRVAATLVDLSSAEILAVTVERRGAEVVVTDAAGRVVVRALPEGLRVGPGAFAEGDTAPGLTGASVEIGLPGTKSVKGRALAGPAAFLTTTTTTTTTADRAPGIFLESDDPAVKTFAACSGSALADALAIAERVHPLVDARKRDEPPSARGMLKRGGDGDGAAALVVAALRSCGHPARALVGYKLTSPGTAEARLVPHAVAALYSDGLWTKVDATVPAIGSLDDVFLPVAEGLGGSLTLGRVLGVIDPQDVVAAAVVDVAPGSR
jgi:hypothetical protein